MIWATLMACGLRKLAVAAVVLISVALTRADTWRPVGPYGGDVRSLTADPRDADRILLGTSSGQLFVSHDGGERWSRMAQLGDQGQYVLDNIVFDRVHRQNIYVAGWDLTGSNRGDLFRSHDDGKTWTTTAALHGKSIRAFVVAPSDSKVLVAGALDGVYRSTDGGDTWTKISPADDAEIKNIESLAIDPRDPAVIYVGTWHLPWKTIDAGRTWISIRRGWIDDSDVFSIAIDQHRPDVVYASACTGVYRSENAAALFHKLKGIPTSARRTRKLQLHPNDGKIVYAGTTQGLYRSVNGGATWKLISDASVIVNDILVDERRPGRVLLATDRSGVLRSENGGRSFVPSNRGFTHRQVSGLVVDRSNRALMYAGVINDKEFGGVFVTHDSGEHWKQMSDGLGGNDVFVLRQTDDGILLAGTNRGLFFFDPQAKRWQPFKWSATAPKKQREKKPRSPTTSTPEASVISPVENSRISDLKIVNGKWYVATSVGLFTSQDSGRTWQGGPVLGQQNFVAVYVGGKYVAALAPRALLLSLDGGGRWYPSTIPSYVTGLFGVTMDGESQLWIAAREGAFRSSDGGDHWEHMLGGLPGLGVTYMTFDDEGKRLLATADSNCFESVDSGISWHRVGESTWHMRGLSLGGTRIFAASEFDGVLVLPDSAAQARAATSASDSSE